MNGIETLSAKMGNKILAAGTHAIKIQGFIARVDDTTVTDLVVNGVTVSSPTDYWPSGTTFASGELFLFAATDLITSITVGAGSVTVIRA